MSSRLFPSLPASRRRPRLRVWASLWMVLAMVAAPWWQQALARSAREAPAMAICSVGGGSGGSPAHLAAGHCPLCCSGQHAAAPPAASFPTGALPGISYPLARFSPTGRPPSPAPGAAQARAPPA